MGVDYFICHHCGGITNDHDDNIYFSIQSFPDYIVCPRCVKNVRSMLVPSESLKYICLWEHKDGSRGILCDFEALQEWSKEIEREDYRFGIYRDSFWKDTLKKSWLGKGKCGGMSREELVVVGKKIEEMILEKKWHFTQTVYLGWRNYEVSETNRYSFTSITPIVTLEEVTGVRNLLHRITCYERENGLENTPLVLAAYGSNLTDIVPVEIMDFSFPNRCQKISWFDDLDSLNLFLNSSSGVVDCSGIEWKVTPTFIKYHRDIAKRKIQEAEEMLSILNGFDSDGKNPANKKAKYS